MGAIAPTSRHHPSLAAVREVAERQHGLVTRAQLETAGLSAEAIKHRVRNGRLHRIWLGVYAVGRPTLTREGRWLAAVLACGDGAALSYLCAAALWQIWERAVPTRPQISVPTQGGRRGPRGIEIHRTAFGPDDVTARLAIPVTGLARTILDLAAAVNARQLRSVMRQAERLHRFDLAALREASYGAPQSSRKHARLRHALALYVPGAALTEADVEMAFLELCARHGLPAPECQVPIGRWRVDFLWRDLGLVVEIDDRQSHDGYVAFRDDRVRDRAMKAMGLEVMRFTRAEVLNTPAAVARELVRAHAALTDSIGFRAL
jgi:hypothetical protein